jgi:hypothetical protein
MGPPSTVRIRRTHHEAPAPIDQKAQPAAIGRTCRAAEAVNNGGAGSVRALSRNRWLTVRMHSRRDLLVVNCAQEPSLISTQRRLFHRAAAN